MFAFLRTAENGRQNEAINPDIYRFLVDRSGDGIAIIQDGRFRFMNPRFLKLLGFAEADLAGIPFEAVVEASDLNLLVDLTDRRARGEDVPAGTELDLRRKDGGRVVVEISAASIRYDGRAGELIVLRDVTARKKAEEVSAAMLGKLRRAMGAAIQAIALTVETRDPTTAGHQKRVADLARTLAIRLGISNERTAGLRMAASIHDLGKISIPSEILNKPGRLSDAEMTLVRTHAQVGYDILRQIDFPWPIADIVYQHHERMDGSGYPRGLKGRDIMVEARILAVADVVESMVSHRPYRTAFTLAEALREIHRQRGVLYDADVVDLCVKLFSTGKYRFNR
jgi:PAS domain S-box-containing protein/putative nucleotidyltransferase with HDIG domain